MTSSHTSNAMLFDVAGSASAIDSGPGYALVSSEPLPPPLLSDLIDPVHPICQRTNWDPCIDYEIIRPGLQLVGYLLRAPRSLSFFHTLITGRRELERYIIRPLTGGKAHFEFTDHPTALSFEEQNQLETQLTTFADKVRFVLANDETDPRHMWVMSTHPDKEGKNFKIHVEEAAIEELRAAAAEFANTGARERYLLASFFLARTICHEFAHVVEVHTDGNANNFFYFPGSSVSELGFEWENQVFGGMIDGWTRSADGRQSNDYIAYIAPWPNPKAVNSILEDKQNVGIRLKHSPGLLPTLTDDGQSATTNAVMAGCFDSAYFEKLFSERFWTWDLDERDPCALHPKVQAWSPCNVRPKVIETFRTLYSNAKPFLEEGGKKCRTAEEFVELWRLCKPWKEFMRLSLPRP